MVVDSYRFAAAAPSFDPFASISWHTAVWADDPNWTNPGDGVAVAQWDDGSGNARHLTQSNATHRPIFRSSVALLNNRAAVDFDGAGDFLSTATFTTVTTQLSLIWIGKRDGVGGGGDERLVDLVSAVSPYTSLYMSTSTGKWEAYANAKLTSSVSYDTTAGHAIRVKYNGASSAINVDGTATTGSLGANNATRVCLGVYNTGGFSGEGNIHTAFAGLYSGDITADGGWADFVSGVSDYYGLTIA